MLHMPQQESFAEQLRAEIDKTGIPIKRLARLVAEDIGIHPESARPLIYKYLRGEVSPEPPMRAALAKALGRPPDFFGRGRTPRQREFERLVGRMADLLNRNRQMERVA